MPVPTRVISATFSADNLAGCAPLCLTLFVVSYNELGRLPMAVSPVSYMNLSPHLILLQLAVDVQQINP